MKQLIIDKEELLDSSNEKQNNTTHHVIPVHLIAHNGTNSPDNTSTFPTTADINDSQTQYNNGDKNVSTMEKHHTTHNTKKNRKTK